MTDPATGRCVDSLARASAGDQAALDHLASCPRCAAGLVQIRAAVLAEAAAERQLHLLLSSPHEAMQPHAGPAAGIWQALPSGTKRLAGPLFFWPPPRRPAEAPARRPPAWGALPFPVDFQRVSVPALRVAPAAPALAGEVTLVQLPDPEGGLDCRLMVASGPAGVRFTVVLAGLAGAAPGVNQGQRAKGKGQSEGAGGAQTGSGLGGAVFQPPAAPAGHAAAGTTRQALPRARVTLRQGPARELLESTTVDQSGMAAFYGVAPGDYALTVERGGRAWEIALHLLAGQDSTAGGQSAEC